MKWSVVSVVLSWCVCTKKKAQFLELIFECGQKKAQSGMVGWSNRGNNEFVYTKRRFPYFDYQPLSNFEQFEQFDCGMVGATVYSGLSQSIFIFCCLFLFLVSDFISWVVDFSDIGTSPCGTFNIKVFYSTDSTLLNSGCIDINTYAGTYYTTCFNSDPFVRSDIGATFTNGIGNVAGTTNIQKSEPLTVGATYYVLVGVYDSVSGDLLHTSSETSFTVGSPTATDTAIVSTSCATFDAVCWIKQGFNWLFAISPATLNQYASLVSISSPGSSVLATKFPFSYIYDIGVLYNELFSNTGSMSYLVVAHTGALGDISLISASQISAVPYAGTIKTILGYIIYLFTAFTLYRMLLKIHSNNH